MGLRWSAGKFRYVALNNELTVFDPSIDEPGPSVLLISKEKLTSFLTENDLVLFWTVLAERLLVRSSEWTGSVEVSGVYSFQNGILAGEPLKAWQRLSSGEKRLLE
jgi:hypothetical protein